MNYYYDILLNLNEELFDFYEWEESDNIEFIKRIPIYRVDNKTLKDILKYQVQFNQELLDNIKNKTILRKNGVLEMVFLITDSKNAIALELDNKGLVINRSKLLISDEINLIERTFNLREVKLKYEKTKKYPERKDLRQIAEKKKLINVEIETLYKNKNKSKLKYLYYEWFNKNEENIENMYKNMKKELNLKFNENTLNIYDLIKLSYNK